MRVIRYGSMAIWLFNGAAQVILGKGLSLLAFISGVLFLYTLAVDMFPLEQPLGVNEKPECPRRNN